jgi:galactose mutarotase-like enzyme
VESNGDPGVSSGVLMARVIHTNDPLETLRLEDEATGASVHIAPSRGGMVTRFEVGSTPVLFLDESTLVAPNKSVRGGIPILFPIAGKLPNGRYEAKGGSFAMNQHGFARNLPWTVQGESTSDGASVTLGLDANDATRREYPFDFALRFTYRLRGSALTVEQRFENHGSDAMPIQPGLHPYFFVPDGTKAHVTLDTDATRARDNLTGREIALELPIALAGREVDLYLLDHHPRETVLHRPGLPGVRIAFGDDQALLVVWTLPGRDFVCVEPWRAKLGALADGTAPTIPAGGHDETTLAISLVLE